MQDTVDLLQIKIEKAKRELSEDTANAINAIDWKAVILGLRTTKGYTFEQLGDLELETELLLCGLLSPADYPKELEKRMGISKPQANELVNEMNELVFKKIREELIKNTERKKIFVNKSVVIKSVKEPEPKKVTLKDILEEKNSAHALKSAGIEIVEKPKETVHPILAQKLSGDFQVPAVKTDHSLENITKTSPPNNLNPKPKIPNIDPYREIPE